ncbi:uncharacterized protein VTP21DRAFT_6242 [Calcarisporiella thermophila]|uniref:uncharacterized protein n=1 Tax=Calcarisporiella thermophila TaxID=911321 RepID=UPI0037431662
MENITAENFADTVAWDFSEFGLDAESQRLLAAALASNSIQNLSNAVIDKRKSDAVDGLIQNEPAKLSHHEHNSSIPHSEQADNDTGSSNYNLKKPGRKPIVSSPEADLKDKSTKRKAQNRAAQRAFRERKEKYVKELEDRIKELEKNETKSSQLEEENKKLREIIQQLQDENNSLKSDFTFEFPLQGHNKDTPLEPVRSLSFPTSSSDSGTPLSSSDLNNTPETCSTSPETDAIKSFTDKRPNDLLFDSLQNASLFNTFEDAPLFPNDSLLSNGLPLFDMAGLADVSPSESSPLDEFVKIENKSETEETKEVVSHQEAWNILVQHPKFDEVDLDSLCSEFTEKCKAKYCATLEKEVMDKLIQKLDTH